VAQWRSGGEAETATVHPCRWRWRDHVWQTVFEEKNGKLLKRGSRGEAVFLQWLTTLIGCWWD
jgi:hypothetical protein